MKFSENRNTVSPHFKIVNRGEQPHYKHVNPQDRLKDRLKANGLKVITAFKNGGDAKSRNGDDAS